MGVAATWLPPELWVIQPYSMGPLMGCPPDQSRPCPVDRGGRFVSPANGTVPILDAPELAILTCFVAPAATQRKAQKEGQRGIIMIRAPGLYEALNGPRPALAPASVVAAQTDWEREQEARRAFAEALAALDDDEDT